MNDLTPDETQDIPALMTGIGQRAKEAAADLAFAAPEAKRRALEAAAEQVVARTPEILAANARDMDFGRDKGLSAAMLDRLTADQARIDGIRRRLRAGRRRSDDPVGA